MQFKPFVFEIIETLATGFREAAAASSCGYGKGLPFRKVIPFLPHTYGLFN